MSPVIRRALVTSASMHASSVPSTFLPASAIHETIVLGVSRPELPERVT